MAGFHTHITVSTLVGVGYAALGAYGYELPLATCAIGGGLCAICGIMPDLDSDNAVPARETLSFLAAVVPMLLFYRFHYEGLATENILLFGAPLYLMIRFGFGQILKASVHRGMFHSLPAMAICGLIAYELCDTGVSFGRIYKGCGASLGYLVHLILDEIWAVELTRFGFRFKKSFGTAMKFLGQSGPANSSTWALLAGMSFFAAHDQGHPEVAAPFQKARPGLLSNLPSLIPSQSSNRPSLSLQPTTPPASNPMRTNRDQRQSNLHDEGWQ